MNELCKSHQYDETLQHLKNDKSSDQMTSFVDFLKRNKRPVTSLSFTIDLGDDDEAMSRPMVDMAIKACGI